ncbi:hypothetical protein DPSP01_012526 [Paraphaeosphaeria sporulosa]
MSRTTPTRFTRRSQQEENGRSVGGRNHESGRYNAVVEVTLADTHSQIPGHNGRPNVNFTFGEKNEALSAKIAELEKSDQDPRGRLLRGRCPAQRAHHEGEFC